MRPQSCSNISVGLHRPLPRILAPTAGSAPEHSASGHVGTLVSLALLDLVPAKANHIKCKHGDNRLPLQVRLC